MDIPHSRFVVWETPYCVWGHNLQRQNLDFIESFDPEFFASVAQFHEGVLKKEDSQHAALSLRLFFGQALETLMALLAATVQAPDCVVGWVSKYRLRPDLENVLLALSAGSTIRSKLNLEQNTWDCLSGMVLRFIDSDDKERESQIKDGFAQFWSRSAIAFLNQMNRFEYNSIKHGLRARSGGYTLRMAVGSLQGPDPNATVHTVAASKYGSSFFVPGKIGDGNRNLSLKHCSTNWQPDSLIGCLKLISMSLNNVLGFLKITNGGDPNSVLFRCPEDLDDFSSVWHGAPGVEHFSTGPTVTDDMITPLEGSEILEVYDGDHDD